MKIRVNPSLRKLRKLLHKCTGAVRFVLVPEGLRVEFIYILNTDRKSGA
jgi:hypothetical protein